MLIFHIFTFRCIKIALLPLSCDELSTFTTAALENLNKPNIGETYCFHIPLTKLCTKTLQVNVWSLNNTEEECLVRLFSFHFSLPYNNNIKKSSIILYDLWYLLIESLFNLSIFFFLKNTGSIYKIYFTKINCPKFIEVWNFYKMKEIVLDFKIVLSPKGQCCLGIS